MKQKEKHCAGHKPARRLALPLLLCGLALFCAFGLAGCGRASRLVGPQHPEVRTLPRQGKITWPELKAARYGAIVYDYWHTLRSLPRNRGPRRTRGYRKAAAIGFAPGEAYIDRALKLLHAWGNTPHELGLFDINEDGRPELMVIVYGVWMRGFSLYDLSGPVPVYLGHHWGPDGPAWARQTEYGTAWRLDGNYSHGYQVLNASELFIPTENGLQVWWCGVDSSPVPVIPGTPVYWRYWIEQSLFEHGRTVFSERREEDLGFPPDELLEDRAARDEEGRPPEEQLEENEYPIAEMDERLEGSLYRRLMNDGWVESPPPWTTESGDVYESNNWNSWLGLDLRTRLRRLYAAWLVRYAAV